MSDSANRDVILERIRKLLSRTAERGASEAEARTAMKMAENLMEAHGLSEIDVIQVAGEEAAVRFSKGDVSTQEAVTPSWDRWIQGCIVPVGTLTNCKGYISNQRDGSKTAKFIGCKTDPYVAVELFKWLAGYVHLAAKQWAKNLRASGFAVGTQSVEFRSFKDGFVAGVHEQADALHKAASTRELQLTNQSGTSTALVVVQGELVQTAKRTAVREWMNENIRLGKARSSRARTHSQVGFNAGKVAGQSVNLNRSTLT